MHSNNVNQDKSSDLVMKLTWMVSEQTSTASCTFIKSPRRQIKRIVTKEKWKTSKNLKIIDFP